MRTLGRGLVHGLGFGLAATIVGLSVSMLGVMERRFSTGVLFLVQTSALEILLGGVLGVLLAPLLRLRFGTGLHLVGLALAWLGLELWVHLDSPIFALLERIQPTGALLLTVLGLLAARWRPRLPWALGAVLLAAALAAPSVYLRATTPAPPPRAELPPARAGAPDVVLVVLDTVRAGSASGWGYGRPTSPELDALAGEGAMFLDATSPSTWSLPSHASLFTGRYPSSHGAHAEHRFLDGRFPTVADVLARNGYETFCITANAWISDGLGLTRGFAFQDEAVRQAGGIGKGFSFVHRLLDRLGLQDSDKGGGLVAGHFEDWARKRPAESERPAFVFLNFIEAHFPYHQLPHEHLFQFAKGSYGALRSLSVDLVGLQFGGKGRPVAEAAGPARDMYDGGVAYSSRLLSRVVEALRARGTLDRTVLVVLADHGEVLGERGGFFGHGPSLYQEAVGVPLLVRYPPRIPAGVRVERPVSTLGVMATILDLAGAAPPPTLQAGSLVPLASGAPGAEAGPVLSELHTALEMNLGSTEVKDPQMDGRLRYRLLREGSLKLVVTSKGDRLLYDLAADPKETREIAGEDPARLAKMAARLAAVEQELKLPALDAPLAVGEDAPELDDATKEQLKALGYAE
jgi:arylsulfatase A-like enzyme